MKKIMGLVLFGLVVGLGGVNQVWAEDMLALGSVELGVQHEIVVISLPGGSCISVPESTELYPAQTSITEFNEAVANKANDVAASNENCEKTPNRGEGFYAGLRAGGRL